MKFNNNKIYNPYIIVPVLVCLILSGMYNVFGQVSTWRVPEKYVNMKNPVKSDVANIKAGQLIWDKNCSICHGKNGLGDGKKAEGLNTPMPDFSKSNIQKQSDGELYYKLLFGREEMPEFQKKITSDNDRWSLVNYIRSLKK